MHSDSNHNVIQYVALKWKRICKVLIASYYAHSSHTLHKVNVRLELQGVLCTAGLFIICLFVLFAISGKSNAGIAENAIISRLHFCFKIKF